MDQNCSIVGTPAVGYSSGGAGVSASWLRPSHACFDPRHHFIEHHLAGQPAVHRLSRVELPRLAQLARSCSLVTKREIASAASSCLSAAANFAVSGPVERGVYA